jgi:hypothetical protein
MFGKCDLHLFIFIQVRVPRIQVTRIVFIKTRTPLNFQFHVVVLNGDDRETRLPRLTEKETKGVKERTRTYTPVKTRRVRFRIRGRHQIDRDIFRKFSVLAINKLTPYVKLYAIYDGSPILYQLRDTIELYIEITMPQKVTRTFKHHTGRTTRFRNTLDGLLLCKRGKVTVSLE